MELPCPHCGRLLRIHDHYAGQTGQCRYCRGMVVALPNPPAPPARAARRSQAFAPERPVDATPVVPETAYDAESPAAEAPQTSEDEVPEETSHRGHVDPETPLEDSSAPVVKAGPPVDEVPGEQSAPVLAEPSGPPWLTGVATATMIYGGFFALMHVVSGLLMLYIVPFGSAGANVQRTDMTATQFAGALIGGSLLTVNGAFYTILLLGGIGLLTRRPWAYRLTLTAALACIAINVLYYVSQIAAGTVALSGGRNAALLAAANTIPILLLLLYLRRADVRRTFSASPEAAADETPPI